MKITQLHILFLLLGILPTLAMAQGDVPKQSKANIALVSVSSTRLTSGITATSGTVIFVSKGTIIYSSSSKKLKNPQAITRHKAKRNIHNIDRYKTAAKLKSSPTKGNRYQNLPIPYPLPLGANQNLWYCGTSITVTDANKAYKKEHLKQAMPIMVAMLSQTKREQQQNLPRLKYQLYETFGVSKIHVTRPPPLLSLS